MLRIIDNVDTGKTKKLLEECIKHDGLFVCRHPERIPDKCAAYGFDTIPAFMGYNEFIFNLKNDKKAFKEVYIDELESFMLNIINLCGYTISKS